MLALGTASLVSTFHRIESSSLEDLLGSETDISAVLSLRDINLQSVVHSGTCTVTFKARHVGLSIRIGGMVQDGLLWDIDNG